MNSVSNIIRSCTKRDKYNILTFPTHERYETQLCKTGHNFYSFIAEDMKKWNTDYAPRPDNYYLLPENSLYEGIGFDFILSQSKFGQIQIASQINQRLQVPMVSLEHTVPIPSWPEGQAQGMANMGGNFNVFISDYSKNEWNPPDHLNCSVIHHGVDTDTFSPAEDTKQEGYVLSVVNDFVNRDYCCNYSGWQRITEGLETRLVGDTEGLSKPAASVEDLVGEYNKCKVFLNTSTFSPVPTTLLEAMSCGCAVVSTATCMIPEVIENGKNGFISNDEKELRSFLEKLLENDDLRNEMGQEARNTIVSKFSEETFVKQWNILFDEVAK